MTFTPSSIPVDELDSDDVSCLFCGSEIAAEAYYVDEFSGLLCESCVDMYVNELKQEARAYAMQVCGITETLPIFDAENQFRCSQDDYELGMKSSNTPNSYLAKCRHECTNYDDLIRPFDRSSRAITDQVFYAAIRDRIEELLIAEIERTQPDEAHEFYAYESLPG